MYFYSSTFILPQIYKDNKPHHYIDAKDVAKSNWMRYCNCARNESEQNLIAFQYQGEIYYKTIQIIYPGQVSVLILGEKPHECLRAFIELLTTRTNLCKNVVLTCAYFSAWIRVGQVDPLRTGLRYFVAKRRMQKILIILQLF
jgi:hypothetical protein